MGNIGCFTSTLEMLDKSNLVLTGLGEGLPLSSLGIEPEEEPQDRVRVGPKVYPLLELIHVNEWVVLLIGPPPPHF